MYDSTQCASEQTFHHQKLHFCNKNFLYKKLGHRHNVAPYKNCNQFFDVAFIVCDFAMKVNPMQNFQENYFCLHNDSRITFPANS